MKVTGGSCPPLLCCSSATVWSKLENWLQHQNIVRELFDLSVRISLYGIYFASSIPSRANIQKKKKVSRAIMDVFSVHEQHVVYFVIMVLQAFYLLNISLIVFVSEIFHLHDARSSNILFCCSCFFNLFRNWRIYRDCQKLLNNHFQHTISILSLYVCIN